MDRIAPQMTEASYWRAEYPYVVGDTVIHEGYMYRCLFTHQSGSDFMTDWLDSDMEEVKWARVGSSVYSSVRQTLLEGPIDQYRRPAALSKVTDGPYSSYFMPSLGELQLIYQNLYLNGIGDVPPAIIVSSSSPSSDISLAYVLDMATGSVGMVSKTSSGNTIAVRRYVANSPIQVGALTETGGLAFHSVDNGDETYTVYEYSGFLLSGSPWVYTIGNFLVLSTDVGAGPDNTQQIIASESGASLAKDCAALSVSVPRIQIGHNEKQTTLSFAAGFGKYGNIDYVKVLRRVLSYDNWRICVGTGIPNGWSRFFMELGDDLRTVISGHTPYLPVYAKAFEGYRADAFLATFEGNNGDTAYTDLYGTQYTFSAANAQISNDTAVSGQTSLKLLGTNGVVSIPCPMFEKSWEIRLRFRATSFAAVRSIIGFSNNYRFAILTNTSGKIVLYISSNGSSWNVLNGTVGAPTLTINTWYRLTIQYDHVAAVYTVVLDDTVLAYASAASPIVRLGAGYLTLGANAGLNCFVGYIDDFSYRPYTNRYIGVVRPRKVDTWTDPEEQHWFDISSMTMYKGRPGSWIPTKRLFVGEVLVNGLLPLGSDPSEYTYAYRGVAESDVFPMIASTSYDFDHFLGYDEYHMMFMHKSDHSASWSLGTRYYPSPYYGHVPVMVNHRKCIADSGNTTATLGHANVMGYYAYPLAAAYANAIGKLIVKRNW